MKRYIKPNTGITTVELQSMIAATVNMDSNTTISNNTVGWEDLAKESETFSSNSVWDE